MPTPAPIEALAAAINAGDYDAFVALFAPDGLVNDWGNIRRGPDGVRSWAHTDAIGAGARMTLRSAVPVPPAPADVHPPVPSQAHSPYEIRFDWVSRVFTGDGHGFVTLRDGLITELRLVE
ncbi:nuclear transport factor 2 family protein [Microbacteriaceae bacterium VKM Ac-2854]|nr:nuclear transport factor 2 family protein [Microbacteriaceae bacterium VKM Ac-2854]